MAVGDVKRIEALAIAVRVVGSLWEMGTMCADPVDVRWESLGSSFESSLDVEKSR